MRSKSALLVPRIMCTPDKTADKTLKIHNTPISENANLYQFSTTFLFSWVAAEVFRMMQEEVLHTILTIVGSSSKCTYYLYCTDHHKIKALIINKFYEWINPSYFPFRLIIITTLHHEYQVFAINWCCRNTWIGCSSIQTSGGVVYL